jgi:hypothetical protein
MTLRVYRRLLRWARLPKYAVVMSFDTKPNLPLRVFRSMEVQGWRAVTRRHVRLAKVYSTLERACWHF